MWTTKNGLQTAKTCGFEDDTVFFNGYILNLSQLLFANTHIPSFFFVNLPASQLRLFLPFRDVKGTELAAHVRRLRPWKKWQHASGAGNHKAVAPNITLW